MLGPIPNSLGMGAMNRDGFAHGVVTTVRGIIAGLGNLLQKFCLTGRSDGVYTLVGERTVVFALTGESAPTFALAGEATQVYSLTGNSDNTFALIGDVGSC